MPREPGVSGSVRAKKRKVPAFSAVEMNCFAPEIRQPPSSGVAGVRIAPASEPASDSVSANAPMQLAVRERRHEAGALLLRPEAQERQRHRARVDRDRHADARVAARELLEHDDVRDEVGARAAVLLRHADAHQSQLGELREDARAGKRCSRSHSAACGAISRAHEVARERLDLLLLRRQVEVHAAIVRGGGERRASCASPQPLLALEERRDDLRIELRAPTARGSRRAPRPTGARAGTGGRSSSRRASRRPRTHGR